LYLVYLTTDDPRDWADNCTQHAAYTTRATTPAAAAPAG
jgi:hypothetical protein